MACLISMSVSNLLVCIPTSGLPPHLLTQLGYPLLPWCFNQKCLLPSKATGSEGEDGGRWGRGEKEMEEEEALSQSQSHEQE